MRKHSTVEVLGCSGSIGIPGEGTTSFLIDEDILIDAGTGLCSLNFQRLEKINHVFITHAHLDHICGLPFLVDSVGVGRSTPLKVYAIAETIHALRQHIFNETIWPDFTRIPEPDHPVMEYVVIEPEADIELNQRTLRTVLVEHTVPAVGVFLTTPTGRWCFSGDTHRTDRLYELINTGRPVDYLFIESAFPDEEQWLADLAKHLCPTLLFAELQKVHVPCQVWISHLKPREYDRIQQQLQKYPGAQPLKQLAAGQVFHI